MTSPDRDKWHDVAVLIVSYRSAALLEACLRSVYEHIPRAAIHVWDNASDGTEDIRLLSQRHERVVWHFSDRNIGFGAAVNRLAERCAESDFLLLNPDAVLTGSLTQAVSLLDGPRVAAASPLVASDSANEAWDVAHRTPGVVRSLVSMSGYAGRLRGWPASDLYRSAPSRGVGYLTGACLLIARRAWQDVGPFDERFFVYCEEVDWARRARARGWAILLGQQICCRHDSHGTMADSADAVRRSNDLLWVNQRRYLEKYYGTVGLRAFNFGTRILFAVQRSKREAVGL